MRKTSTHTFLLAVFCLALTVVHHTARAQKTNTNTPLVLDGHQQRHVITAYSASQVVTFEQLLKGQTYALVIPNDPALGACQPAVSAVDPALNVLGWEAASRQLRFVASGATASFRFDYPCTVNPADPPRHYISLLCQSCTKKKLKEYIKDMAVLEVQGGGSAEELVKEVLIGGNCFDITGVTFAGVGGQIGRFTNGQTNVGFSTGMVMATGDINVCPGPNDQDNASAGYGNGTGDPDLSGLANGGSIFDMANIEFDFTPTQTPLTFEYVFASEEYCEYVGTQFNDVFGFFISGPGFSGTQNIAVLPSGAPVSINNVNHQTNNGFYVHNTPASGNNCGKVTPSVAAAVNELQFDGFTRRMVALAQVVPCQTYHIKLKIGDVGDGIFDSAVFLKEGSFDAGGNASVDWAVNDDPDIDAVYEGCGTVKLIFDRVGSNINVPLVVQYTVTGTATPGVDYTPIPSSVVIPAGKDKLELTVNILTDALLEGDETVTITLVNPCSCLLPQTILTIKDLLPVKALVDTVQICGPGVGTLTVTPEGGAEPYKFKWSNGTTSETITQYVAGSTDYKVTVTDDCGKTSVATGRIIVNAPPTAQLLPPAPQLCPGQSGTIVINFNGVGPFEVNYSLNGDPQTPLTGITDDPYTMTINQVGLYQVTSVTDSRGCTGPGQGALFVKESNLSMTGIVSNVKCSGQANGSINTTVLGGQGPYNYVWQGPQPITNLPDPVNLQAGTYTVTVTDGFGCTNSQTFNVIAPNAVTPAVVNVTGPNCTTPTGGSIDLDVTGGTPAFSYKWNNGSTLQDPVNLAQGTYTVTVTDLNGCTKTTTASVVGDFSAPTAVASGPNPLTCIVTAVTIDGTGSSSGSGFTYLWTTSGTGNISGGATTLNPTVNAPGPYVLKVTNTGNGCTATAQVQVNSTVAYPNAVAGPPQTITCSLPNVNLDGTGSSTGANFTYLWTTTPTGNIIGGATTLNAIAGTAAVYTLVVTNTANGCTTSSSVTVNQNTSVPTAAIAPPAILSCTNKTVTLNGSGSTPATGVSYSWTTTNGNIQSGQTSANAVVNESGQYTLIVTNNANGCSDTETISVTQDNSVPLANAAVTGNLDCKTAQLTINGAGSSTGTGYTFQWTSSTGSGFVSGQNTLNPVVNAPATYTLLVTNTANNCTANASILVTQDILKPVANPGSPATLTCLATTQTLGDPNAPVAPNLSYSWTTAGGNISAGANTPTPTVNQPGTYTLLVTNSQNNCSSTATVVIDQNIAKPTAVAAPAAQLDCTTPVVQLNGNGSSTGPNFIYNWTSNTGGGIGAGVATLTPTVTAAGTYTLQVTNNSNGCTSTASTTVASNSNLPTAVATPSGILTCNIQQVTLSSAGSSAGSTFEYQWGTVGGQIISGGNTATATVGKAGQYTLLVTNTANNCTATFNVNVDADVAAPVANAGTTATLSCTQPSLTLNGSGSSTGANFTYAWTVVGTAGNFVSPVNIANPSVNEPGHYQILVTNTQNGCTSTSQVEVMADANDPVAQVVTPGILNCKNGSQINLNGAGSTTGSNISYLWNGPSVTQGGTTLTPTVTQPGNYTLVITNSTNGCSSSLTIPVAQDILAPGADAGSDEILNCYHPQLLLGGTGNPTGTGYTFAWTGPGIIAGGNTSAPTVNQVGLYQLVVTNTDNGCTSTDSTLLNADFDQPMADAGPGFQLTCAIDNYTLQAIASTGSEFTYAWTTNTGNFTTSDEILNPTVNGEGNYYLTVTDVTNGCTAVSDVQITKAADVPVSLASNSAQLTCSATTLTLSGAGSSNGTEFTYQWQALDGGNIVSGGTSLSPVIDQPGKYELVVTNTTNNCKAFSSVIVTEDVATPDIEAGPIPTLTCAVTSTKLTGAIHSNGTFTYQWTTQGGNILSGATTLTPTVNATGIYILTATNTVNGCTSTASTLVDDNVVPPLSAIQTPAVLTCKIKEITLDGTASSTGNYTYDWTTAGGHYTDLTNKLLPKADKPGTYILVVTNVENGCKTTSTATVTQDIQNPVAQAGSDGLITCSVTSMQLDGSQSSQGGGINYFYQWSTSGSGQILTGGNTLTPTVVAGGTYTLNVVNNDNGCSSSDDVLVNVDVALPIVAIASPDILTCIKPEVTLNGSASQSGNGIVYAWTTLTGNIIGNLSTNSTVANAPGDYTLTVLNTNNGCSNAVSVAVGSNIALPIAEAGTPFTLTCTVEEVTLQGNGSTGSTYSYVWSTQGGQFISGSTTLQPKVNKEGVYKLTVSNTSTGCTSTDDVVVFRENNVPTNFVINLDPPSCKDNDGTITIGEIAGGVGPYLYSIDGGNTFTPALEFDKIAPATYKLMIQDVNGCEFLKTLVVPKALDPGISIVPELKVSLGDSLTLQASLPLGYPLTLIDTVIWTPVDGLYFKDKTILGLLTPGAKPVKQTEYTVKLVSFDGCAAEDRVLIRVDNEPHIYIPNAFSPWDANGANDKVYIFADDDQIVRINSFQIFDRWGEMVFQDHNFQPNDPAHGWNGRHDGKLMVPAVFAYYAEILMIDGRVLLYKGDVTLVR